MTWIILKVILAMILTSIPFAIKYIIVPMGEKDKKWKNLFCLMESRIPATKRYVLKLIKTFKNFKRKMEISKKHRHFYIFMLVLVLVSIQIVNNKASMEVADIVKTATYHENFDLIRSNYITAFGGRFVILLGLGWFVQLPTTNLAILLMTILLFRKKLANKWLEATRNNKKVQFGLLLIMLATLFAPTSDGFVISELMFTFMLFASYYSAFNNSKSRRYYAFKQIRFIRTQNIKNTQTR